MITTHAMSRVAQTPEEVCWWIEIMERCNVRVVGICPSKAGVYVFGKFYADDSGGAAKAKRALVDAAYEEIAGSTRQPTLTATKQRPPKRRKENDGQEHTNRP